MVHKDSAARVTKIAKHLAILTTFSSSYAAAELRSAYDSYEHHMDWGSGFFGGLGMLLVWVLVTATIVLAVKYALGSSHNTSSSSAVDILKESFARGEIDEEEYSLRKKLLDES